MSTINKADFIASLATLTGLSKVDSEKALNGVLATVTSELKAGNKVQFVGFGTFEVKDRAAREGRNPQTGEALHIEAKKVPAFTAGESFKSAIAG